MLQLQAERSRISAATVRFVTESLLLKCVLAHIYLTCMGLICANLLHLLAESCYIQLGQISRVQRSQGFDKDAYIQSPTLHDMHDAGCDARQITFAIVAKPPGLFPCKTDFHLGCHYQSRSLSKVSLHSQHATLAPRKAGAPRTVDC